MKSKLIASYLSSVEFSLCVILNEAILSDVGSLISWVSDKSGDRFEAQLIV